jgi:cytoskeletal protein RodZ
LNREYLKALKLPEKTEVWRKALAGGQFSSSKEEEQDSSRPPKPVSSSQLLRKSAAPKSPALMWTAIAIVVIAVGLVAWKQLAGKSEKTEATPAPVAANTNVGADAKSDTKTPAQPADPVESPAETQAIEAAFDALQIQGIIYSSSRPVALINGHPCSIGDKINSITLTSITPTNVLLTYKSHQKTLAWKK